MSGLRDLGPVSISNKTSFCKISQSFEAARFVFWIARSLWNLISTSAALSVCLSNFKAMQWFKLPISWLQDFTRSYDKTSYRILKRGPGCQLWIEGPRISETTFATHCCGQCANYSAMTHASKNGLAPAEWYYTQATTTSRFRARIIPHWAAYTRHKRLNVILIWRGHNNISAFTGSRVNTNYVLVLDVLW